MARFSLENIKVAEIPPMMIEVKEVKVQFIPLDRQYGDNKDAKKREINITYLPTGGTRTGNPMFYSFSEPTKGQNKSFITFQSLSDLQGNGFEGFFGDEEGTNEPNVPGFLRDSKYFLVQRVPVGNRLNDNGKQTEALKFLSVLTADQFEEGARQKRQPKPGEEQAVVQTSEQTISNDVIIGLVTTVGGTKTEIQKRALAAPDEVKKLPGLIPGLVSGKLLDKAVEDGVLVKDGNSYKLAGE